MNQHDWEKLKEEPSITNVDSITGTSWLGAQTEYNVNTGILVNGTYSNTQAVDGVFERFREASALPYNPSAYGLGGSTSWISGSVSDLVTDNEVHMTFRSYSTGTDTSDFVDISTSDVDSSADKGTHSSFPAQQSGPDSVYDTLTEVNTSGATDDWGITSSGFSSTTNHANYRYMGGTSPNLDNMRVTKLHIRYSGTGTVAIALYTGGTLTNPTGATKVTEEYNVAVTTGWNEIDVPDYDWEKNTVTWIGWCHAGGSVYYSSSSGAAGDFQSARGRWSQSSPSNADETTAMPTSPSYGSFNNYWYAVYVEYEVISYELDLEAQWTNVDYDETNEELAIYVNTVGNSHSLDATGGYMIVGNGNPDWGSTSGTISFWIQWDTVANRPWGQHTDMEARMSGTNLVLDWGGDNSLTSSTSFTSGQWYFIAITWNEATNELTLYVGDEDTAPAVDASTSSWFSAVSTGGVTQNNFMASRGGLNPIDGHGDDLRYYDTDRSLPEIQSDYNTELTGSETNLRSYFKLNNDFDDIGPDNNDGSGSGSYSFSSSVPFGAPPTENLRVDVWTGATWQNIFTDLTNGWNNASVSSYLDSSTFTIRFKGGTETSDATQDSWDIDATLLKVWSSGYVVDVEFTGSSDIEDWSQLTWMIDSAWTTGSVDVTLQLYNFTLGGYPTSGDGYINYLSSATADTDETQSQTITQNPTHFRNATGHWKMKIRGVKTTDTSFDFKADWVELSPQNYQLDMNGDFTIDLSTYSPEDIQAVEIQLRYRTDDSEENWYLKAYNWTASTYSDSGFNSTAGHTPTTGWDYYAVNLTNVWQSYVHSNGTIKVKIVDQGVDSNQTSVDIDFLGVKAKIDGTQFTFENNGGFTIHLVSLWVNNSTDHQRYDINIFVNSAETKNYLRTDISLPTDGYTVKVVTERGNTAVYSGN